jgi:putative PIN family toxin of toxin-antitoxin system
MPIPELVLDTNVLVAGLRSQLGAAFDLLSLVGTGRFGINVSVPLPMEYEDVLYRGEIGLPVGADTIEAVLDYHCTVARRHEIFFLWRPVLKDQGDDMVLELAVKARADFIVTYNQRDFVGCDRFGIEAITPGEFLRRIGVYR